MLKPNHAMKNIIFIIALLSVLANCKKNQSLIDIIGNPIDTVPTPIHTPIIELGKVSVLKNGDLWNVPFYARYYSANNRFFLRGKILHSNLIGETFALDDIPCESGKYPVEFWTLQNRNNLIPEALLVMMYEFDQPIGDFLVDTTRTDHFVEVIRYDSIEKTVEGRFQVFLGKKPTSVPFPGVPDSIFLTEGKFHLKIEDP